VKSNYDFIIISKYNGTTTRNLKKKRGLGRGATSCTNTGVAGDE
jgi:hypothetical protein